MVLHQIALVRGGRFKVPALVPSLSENQDLGKLEAYEWSTLSCVIGAESFPFLGAGQERVLRW